MRPPRLEGAQASLMASAVVGQLFLPVQICATDALTQNARTRAHARTGKRAHTHTRTRAHTRACAHTRTRAHTRTCAHTHAHVQTHAHAHIHAHTHTHTQTHTRTHMQTYDGISDQTRQAHTPSTQTRCACARSCFRLPSCRREKTSAELCTRIKTQTKTRIKTRINCWFWAF